MSRRRILRSAEGKVGVLAVGQPLRACLLLLTCAILMVALCAPGAFAKEVYKSALISCWENAGYYYGTPAIGVRVSFDSTNKRINWIKVSVTPYYEIYPTTDNAETDVVVKGLSFKKADGSYYRDNTEWYASGTKAEYTYWPDSDNNSYGYPEVFVFFEANEGISESQHRWKWNAQHGFEKGYFYVNNNEPGYASYKPAACPY